MAALLGFLGAHWDIIEAAYDAIVNKKVDRAKVLAAIRQEMVNKADEEMRAAVGP